jgi:hypothetical protein
MQLESCHTSGAQPAVHGTRCAKLEARANRPQGGWVACTIGGKALVHWDGEPGAPFKHVQVTPKGNGGTRIGAATNGDTLTAALSEGLSK